MFEVERYVQVLINDNGKAFEVPLRKGQADSAFIDQISFTFKKHGLNLISRNFFAQDDYSYIVELSSYLELIFGFGISEKLKGSGGRFYKECFSLGSPDCLYGRVHIGGQNDTILVEMTAKGCNVALDGWETRLFNFLTSGISAKITRVDLAKDFFNGEYTPEQASQDRLNGFFTSYRTIPCGERVGTDWESKTKKGKTYYVGSRESSKFCRIYEKGKQLGDKNSNWVRFEIEFKSRDILIPFDVLSRPGEYFGGAYPICETFQNEDIKAERIYSIKKNLDITFEKSVEFAKKQCGRVINAAISMYPEKSASEILNMFKNEQGLFPKRLNLSNFSSEYYNSSLDLHNRENFIISDGLDDFINFKMNYFKVRDELISNNNYLRNMYSFYSNS